MTTRQTDDAPVVEQTPESEPSSDPDELRGQIEETRADLGDTVEALAAKADVKAQVKEKVEAGKEQIKEKQEQASAKLAEVRDKVGDKVSGATPDQAREVVGSLPERIKGQPLPAVFLAGFLLGWLLGKRR
jgi:ElaB/YqjD/DUF883 family membrane-anchored ribosome-binding protein